MKTPDSHSLMVALRQWLDAVQDKSEGNADRLAEFIVEQALNGDSAFFTLLLNLTDGKIRKTAEDESTGEPDCFILIEDDERAIETARAA
jgi:hypothetical protein